MLDDKNTQVEPGPFPGSPPPLRSYALGGVVSLLGALLLIWVDNEYVLRPQGAPLLAGFRALGMLATASAAGAILSAVLWRLHNAVRFLVSLLFGSFATVFGVTPLCSVPIVAALGFLLLAPKITPIVKKRATPFLVAYVAVVDAAAGLFLIRPSVFTTKPIPSWISLLIACLAVAFPLLVVYQTRRRKAILKTWPITTGKILKVDIKLNYGGDVDTYTTYVTFEYSVGDKLLSSTDSVAGAASSYRPGDAVAVRYDPAKPQSAMLEAAVSDALLVILFIFPLIIGAILWGFASTSGD